MTVTATNKDELIIPSSVRRQAGIKLGDRLEFKVCRRKITILAKPGEEYTQAQRRAIDARLAIAQKGPYHGPFATANEALGFICSEKRKKTLHKNALDPGRSG